MTAATDRDLLELAAKAAGLKHLEWSPLRTGSTMAHIHRDDSGRREELWNPLTDDGDALRLAVKLHLFIRPYGFLGPDGGAVVVGVADWPGIAESANGDQLAATRRAIVRAAAEMGQART